jgi:hypothetical protein
MRELHIKIEKCEDCPFRQWLYESDGCREEEGYWCYHPDKLEWVSKEKYYYQRNKFVGGNLYEGDFPTDCPLSETEEESQ